MAVYKISPNDDESTKDQLARYKRIVKRLKKNCEDADLKRHHEFFKKGIKNFNKAIKKLETRRTPLYKAINGDNND